MKYFAKIENEIIRDLWAYEDDANPALYGHDTSYIELPAEPMPENGWRYTDGVLIAPPTSLDDQRAWAKKGVDDAAEAYRLTFITSGAGQAMAYQQKLEEAKAYLADTSLTAAECPHVFAEIGITGDTAEAVAKVVVGMHAAWQVKSADIEHKRLSAKAAIDAAETVEAIAEAEKVAWVD